MQDEFEALRRVHKQQARAAKKRMVPRFFDTAANALILTVIGVSVFKLGVAYRSFALREASYEEYNVDSQYCIVSHLSHAENLTSKSVGGKNAKLLLQKRVIRDREYGLIGASDQRDFESALRDIRGDYISFRRELLRHPPRWTQPPPAELEDEIPNPLAPAVAASARLLEVIIVFLLIAFTHMVIYVMSTPQTLQRTWPYFARSSSARDPQRLSSRALLVLLSALAAAAAFAAVVLLGHLERADRVCAALKATYYDPSERVASVFLGKIEEWRCPMEGLFVAPLQAIYSQHLGRFAAALTIALSVLQRFIPFVKGYFEKLFSRRLLDSRSFDDVVNFSYNYHLNGILSFRTVTEFQRSEIVLNNPAVDEAVKYAAEMTTPEHPVIVMVNPDLHWTSEEYFERVRTVNNMFLNKISQAVGTGWLHVRRDAHIEDVLPDSVEMVLRLVPTCEKDSDVVNRKIRVMVLPVPPPPAHARRYSEMKLLLRSSTWPVKASKCPSAWRLPTDQPRAGGRAQTVAPSHPLALSPSSSSTSPSSPSQSSSPSHLRSCTATTRQPAHTSTLSKAALYSPSRPRFILHPAPPSTPLSSSPSSF